MKTRTLSQMFNTVTLTAVITIVGTSVPVQAEVRDHRTNQPLVRDHRTNQPVVRDHRSPLALQERVANSSGGVLVTTTPSIVGRGR